MNKTPWTIPDTPAPKPVSSCQNLWVVRFYDDVYVGPFNSIDSAYKWIDDTSKKNRDGNFRRNAKVIAIEKPF